MKIDNAKVKEPPQSLRKRDNKEFSRGGLYSENLTGEYYNFPLEKLLPFKNQARVDFNKEKLESLAETIKNHGIRQPLTIVPSPQKEGKYEIVSGERRFKAAELAKIDKVPCIIINDYKKAEEISLIENIQREDLHPIELGVAFKGLIKREIFKTYDELADKLSITKSTVSECVSFTKFPQSVIVHLVSNRLSNRKLLRDLKQFSSADKMMDYINTVQEEKQVNKTVNKAITPRSIRSLFALTRKSNDLVFKHALFNKLDSRKKIEIINQIESIVNGLKEEM